MKAIRNRAIVKKLAAPSKTDGGLFIPDVAQGKAGVVRGKVIATGSEVRDFAAGDTILLGQFDGIQFSHGGEEFLSIVQEQALCVVDEAK